MKRVVLLLMIGVSFVTQAQEGLIYEPTEVSVKASYKNGTGDIMTYVSSNFKQPFTCVMNKVKTSFRMRFVINEDGTISNISVIGCTTEGSCCEEMTESCVDLLTNMKDWRPAEHNGIKVKQWGEIPLSVNNGGT